MNLVEQVYIFGLSNIHTYKSNISLIRLFSLIFNYAKPSTYMVSLVLTNSLRIDAFSWKKQIGGKSDFPL